MGTILDEQVPVQKPRGPSSCLVIALLIAVLFLGGAAIVVIGGGDRALKALEMLRGPQVVTVQVTPGEVIPVLKLAVEELHTTVHTKRTGLVLGGAVGSLPRHIIANGTITACFNIESETEFKTQIDPEDPQHITVQLPPPEYCFAGIDSAEFFDEAGLGLPAGNDVNGLLLEDVQKQLYTAADSQKLLEKAKTRGEDQVRVLLLKLGFKRVDIEFGEGTPVE